MATLDHVDLELIAALSVDPRATVVALAENFDMARPSVSEHLKVLRDCGLVTEDRQGRFRRYRVNPEPLQEISTWLCPYERFWRERLTALGAVLDEEERRR